MELPLSGITSRLAGSAPQKTYVDDVLSAWTQRMAKSRCPGRSNSPQITLVSPARGRAARHWGPFANCAAAVESSPSWCVSRLQLLVDT